MSDEEILSDDLPAEEENEEKAFFRSAEHEFRGEKLQPFSFWRVIVAQRMGLHYWKISREDVDDGALIYNEFLDDATLVLWLCRQPLAVVKRARLTPQKFIDEMLAWGAKAQLLQPGTVVPCEDVITTFFRIMEDIDKSVSIPDFPETEGTERKN